MSTNSPGDDRSECTPCRGTGSLTSNQGGEPHQVTCPWCGGTGQFQAGHDAQAAAGSVAESVLASKDRPDS